MERPWDKNKKYAHAAVKEYRYWVLEVSCRQHALATTMTFLKRDAQHFSELTSEELLEFKDIVKELEIALGKSEYFKPDRMNFLQLGNNLKWLHMHCVPRYSTPRQFAGKEWNDANFGHPVVWTYEEESVDVIKEIVNEIKKWLR